MVADERDGGGARGAARKKGPDTRAYEFLDTNRQPEALDSTAISPVVGPTKTTRRSLVSPRNLGA
jgi:hypothetical protein